MMDISLSILLIIVGLVVGAASVYLFLRSEKKQHQVRVDGLNQGFVSKLDDLQKRHQGHIENLIWEHESKVYDLQEQNRAAISRARKESVNQSRSVLKGKVAEQMAPLLPGFAYLPSDARFIGNPVDYIVFDGYTGIKDDGQGAETLQVVILDVKSGRSSLTTHQRVIAKAIEAGRIRFEMVRVSENGTIKSRVWQPRHIIKQASSSKENQDIKDGQLAQIRENHLLAHERWTENEDNLLKRKFDEGANIVYLSTFFQRKPSAIRSRLRKLGLS